MRLGPRIGHDFFARSVLEVAPALLGATITRHGITVRVTETEAYGGAPGSAPPMLVDPGSHAYRGLTPRTAPMFGPAGVTYVYFTYGMHWMLCLVTGPPGVAEAVLVRAGEVVAGHDRAAQRRPGVAQRDWCRGPARLANTLGLTGRDSGRRFVEPAELDLTVNAAPSDPVGLTSHRPFGPVHQGPRVGVSGPGGDADSYPWRFWLADEPTVSSYRAAKPRRRPTSGEAG